MHSAKFIRNAWYVAGRSVDFEAKLTALKLLGARVVIFRRPDGSPAALEDACPHRKLPLSMGNLHGDRVECGYHGLTFDGAGACVSAPTQGDPIPKRARVRSYPVEDRYGFLWIWMGEDAPGEIIDIPNYDNPAWGKTARGALTIACNYLYVIDNLLDPSHVAWVHVGSFAGAGTDNRPLDLEDIDEGVIVSRWIMGEPAPPYYRDMLAFGDATDRKQHYECRLPSTAINMSVYTRAGTGGPGTALPQDAYINISYNFITPVDEANALYFWFQHRNTDPDNEATNQRMFEGATMAFNEDKEVLEAVQIGMTDPATPYMNLGLDAGAMRFRAKVDKRIAAESGGA
ncbi:Vanillate O-demethylase oxygenase subunit [Candidatus Rhodobacter oscarellae]|uniref:Vanillate O-demethylase oxygenase subunit n=1 Tax=Candidatus Rhodobacter oscarellae TaxID=1675527 RepID=A0A0J9E6P1_9RHOB|nr:aromatic ring-hydroxylating dioxygenase subunit alpha [Candidatus Rhodobacter lobularis]KMW57489.1 Vanillate O-demethylase oxygenase subunit [Candidatus Rhodobacter lobularis]